MLPVDDLLNWFSACGREFPWRFTNSPFKVLISEILLQQTNADKVIGPYLELIENFPTINSLADADQREILEIFSKLGLYFRANRLKTIASEVLKRFNGEIPSNLLDLKSIKGIGDYIGNSVLCFGFMQKKPIVDTNIIRIFSRYGLFDSTKKRPHTDKQLWSYAESILPDNNYVEYNYSLLDLGAGICKSRKPLCESCPINMVCRFHRIRLETN
jgi:A/G-specific adenine glycosylase